MSAKSRSLNANSDELRSGEPDSDELNSEELDSKELLNTVRFSVVWLLKFIARRSSIDSDLLSTAAPWASNKKHTIRLRAINFMLNPPVIFHEQIGMHAYEASPLAEKKHAISFKN
ncbi:MAG: hypothetical protein ACYDHX_08930 [Methanothrix sp.]